MANPLTGDFDAVLEVSGATVNRLLANMHQNAGSKPSIPTFPHGAWIRIGDPNPIHGMRGNILGQVSVPHIDLIHGVSDRFWLEVSVRARYTADPGTVKIPEFINGVIRAQYRIDTIDPSCSGWQKLAPDYLWIRAIGDTVSFTGTAEDDVNILSVIPSTSNAAADDARITQLAMYLLTHQFEATPHKVSRRFRRGAMRSLNVGANRSAVAVPIGISGDPSAGNIASVDQDFLDGKDVGIAVNRDYIMGKIQEQLDAIKASFLTNLEFHHKTSVDLGFLGGFDVLTITIDYTVTLTSATAQWLGGFPGLPGLNIPGGLVVISIHGQGLTQKAIFNFDFDVTQLLLISFDASSEEFVASPFGSAAVHVGGTFGSIIESRAKPKIQKDVATLVQNAADGMAGELSLSSRKGDLIKQLQTMDDAADVWFDNAVFTPDGVIVRGVIALSGRRAPVPSFAITYEKDAYTAYESWIPGGRVDSFSWTWNWFNNGGSPGSATVTDRFVKRRPPASLGTGRFGITRGLRDPLPGLDGMGMACLVVEGVQVDSITGALVSVSTTRKCKRFGFDIRLATPGRVFLTEWVPGPRDPIGPVSEVAVHEVGGPDAQGHGANTLVVRIGDRWNREAGESLREGLANSTRRDAGMVVLVLFNDGKLMQQKSGWMTELEHLASELEAPLVVNEDVRGSWSTALGMEMHDGSANDLQWRLISPTGGVTWARNGSIEGQELARVLDDYLFKSPIPAAAQYTRGVTIGTRVSGSAFASDVVGTWRGDLADVEATCPPPPFGRLGVQTSATFVSHKSFASDAALRKLASKTGSASDETFNTIVVDGATAEEVEQMRRSLPEGVMAIADPDGAVSKRFGIRVWPSSLVINETGSVTKFESGMDAGASRPVSGEAS